MSTEGAGPPGSEPLEGITPPHSTDLTHDDGGAFPSSADIDLHVDRDLTSVEWQDWGRAAKIQTNHGAALNALAFALVVLSTVGTGYGVNWILASNGLTGWGAVACDLLIALIVFLTGYRFLPSPRSRPPRKNGPRRNRRDPR